MSLPILPLQEPSQDTTTGDRRRVAHCGRSLGVVVEHAADTCLTRATVSERDTNLDTHDGDHAHFLAAPFLSRTAPFLPSLHPPWHGDAAGSLFSRALPSTAEGAPLFWAIASAVPRSSAHRRPIDGTRRSDSLEIGRFSANCFRKGDTAASRGIAGVGG